MNLYESWVIPFLQFRSTIRRYDAPHVFSPGVPVCSHIFQYFSFKTSWTKGDLPIDKPISSHVFPLFSHEKTIIHRGFHRMILVSQSPEVPRRLPVDPSTAPRFPSVHSHLTRRSLAMFGAPKAKGWHIGVVNTSRIFFCEIWSDFGLKMPIRYDWVK